ncbi:MULTISPECIES: cell envelope integrity protein CreD [Sphingobacterium]|uniref:cell envelope integrity protein CreD n=1 Tax=Sphingobacterium TaxID=28453 RepID=UPI001F09EBF5|nr:MULTISPECIES: cell envelope integrity protein CreD [unclassified Sphingobacterium]
MENESQKPPQLPSSSMTIFERISNSIILKLFVIFILVLIMMIPMSLIDDLVSERKNREQQVSSEIAAKWGRDQVVSSPVLAVPYEYLSEVIEKDSKGKDYTVQQINRDWVFLLPGNTQITTEIKPESLKRGIYQSVVYNSELTLKGTFDGFDSKQLPVELDKIKWKEAQLVFGIQDVKGLSSNPAVMWGNDKLTLAMNVKDFDLFNNNMTTSVPLANIDDTKSDFQIKVKLRGSKSVNFLPLANHNLIQAKGSWGNPSFNGAYLPEAREVSDKDFNASWNIPSFGRKVPQQWSGANTRLYRFSGMSLADADFDTYVGTADAAASAVAAASTSIEAATDMDMVQINFLPEVNNYQKTTRVAKYGILVIVLTFASLFFTEIIKKQRIHLIQYILIGAAMVLFYSLLLAISEHMGFNVAYLLAAIATVGLIASFIKMITKDNRTALLFMGILGLFYGFIFVLMQLRDYSLIVGTIGIFIILAILMRISTKINWYQFDKQ